MWEERGETEMKVPADRNNVQSKGSQQQSGRHKGTGHSTYPAMSETAKTCRKGSQVLWESGIHSWTCATSTHVQCLTEFSWLAWEHLEHPAGEMKSLFTCTPASPTGRRSSARKGRPLQSVSSWLVRRKNKWPQSLSCTDTHGKHEESDRRAEKDTTSCSSIKNCIYKFLLWRVCGLGIWSVLTAKPADT